MSEDSYMPTVYDLVAMVTEDKRLQVLFRQGSPNLLDDMEFHSGFTDGLLHS